MSSLLRNSWAKAFGNCSRGKNSRPKKPRGGGGFNEAPLLASLRFKGIFGITHCIFKINSQLVALGLGQSVDLGQSEPVFTLEVSETYFVLIPSAEEVDQAVQSLLEDCPSSSRGFLITKHVKGAFSIRVDLVHTAHFESTTVDFSAVLLDCKKQRISCVGF